MESPKVTILSVDDDEASLYARTRILRSAGFDVVEATTGTEALRLAEEIRPNIALLDVRLPDVSGIEVSARIKANPATASILIIQTSATYRGTRDKVRGLENGADAYLAEPIAPDELVANIRAMLRLQRAEQAVREREAWFSTTLRSIGDAVIATDLKSRITLMNPVAQLLTGWDEREARGRFLRDVFQIQNEGTGHQVDDPIEKVLREGRVVGLPNHSVLISRDGRHIPIDDSAAPIRDETGNLLGVVLIFRDVTEQRRADEQLGQSLDRELLLRAKAEAANRLKDEFVATVSHELRTPLNSIKGWVHLLRAGRLTPDQTVSALEVVERSVRSQNQIVEDLLDISRITTGKLRLDIRPVAVNSVIEAAIETVLPAAEAKGIVVEATLDQSAETIAGDHNRLQQVVWNLLSNAIKFSRKGGSVRVLSRRTESHLEITVEDNGQGISPDFLPFVFDRFRQEDATPGRKHRGLGLGLAIVRHLVEAHGGEVQAHSEGDGKGATFTVILPVVPVPLLDAGREPVPLAVTETNPDLHVLDGVHILVVDDEADARELIAVILGQRGAVVTTAASTPEALELMDKTHFDLLISDIGMPNSNGYALIRKVRERKSEHGGNTPAIALTAFAQATDRVQAILAGYLTHVPKPVEPAELIAVVASLTTRRKGGASG